MENCSKPISYLLHSKNQTITYLDGICKTVETLRVNMPDSYLQNQVDTIIELIQSTLYKLKNLN